MSNPMCRVGRRTGPGGLRVVATVAELAFAAERVKGAVDDTSERKFSHASSGDTHGRIHPLGNQIVYGIRSKFLINLPIVTVFMLTRSFDQSTMA
jgi:hypothetical protein